MLPGKKYTPDDVLRILRKRWWMIVAPAVVGTIGAALYSYTLPNRYRSETIIMVTPQQIPEAYVRSFGGQRIEDRLAALQQQILSRTRLERVITDFNLYPEQRRQMPMEDVVDVMRRDISARAVRGDVFVLAYHSNSARSAKEVTERLASMFIDENLRNRMSTADSTSQFLQAQLADTKRKLEQIERRRAEFRQRYMGQLPEEVPSNIAVINSTQNRAQSLTDSNAADMIRKANVERQIAELTMPTTPGEGGSIDYSAGSLASTSPTAVQLGQAQEALGQLRLRLREDHPDIKRMQRTIEDLQLKLDRESAERPISPSAPRGGAQSRPDPRQLRVTELRAELAQVTAAIKQRETELARLNATLGQFESRVMSSPVLENQRLEIERDYATFLRQYNDLLASANSAEMAAGVEQRQIGEQFRVLDAARVPERPYSPDRQTIVAVGLVGGLALGLGLIALLEFRDASFHTPDDIVAVLALPVVAAIPIIQTKAAIRTARKRRFAMSVATAVVLLVGVTFLFVRYGL